MSKKPKRKKFDLDRFQATADRRRAEASAMWAAMYTEPIYVGEDRQVPESVKTLSESPDFLKAKQMILDAFKKAGGAPPG